MGRVIEIDITPEIPQAEHHKALDWCKRFGRSWQHAKRHRQERAAVYRRNVIEPLEPRRLLSITSGVSISGIDPPVDNGSSGYSPNAIVGQGINPNFSYNTDHDDVDNGAAHAEVNYGDGTITDIDSNSGTTGIGHTYTDVGTYTLSVFVWDDAGYNTYNNSSWDGNSSSSTALIVVGDSALSAQVDQFSGYYPGDDLPNFIGGVQHIGGATNYSATVNWGDGSSIDTLSFDSGGGMYAPTHSYASPGNYTITVNVADDDGSHTTGTGTATISPAAVWLTQTALGDLAEESNQQPATVIFNRAGGSDPVTVAFTMSGTASTDDYTLMDTNGNTLSNSVTIPANSSSVGVEIIPADDSTPEWSETAILTVTDVPTSYAFNSPPATSCIVDNDLSLALDNTILTGTPDGTTGLVPLHLSFPSAVKNGATVTLATTAPGKVDVWTSNTPNPGDTPLIGGNISSKTWTVGTDQIPDTLYLAATNGSQSQGDISFVLQDSDGNATTQPAYPTTNSTAVAATAIVVKIVSATAPNGDNGNNGDVTNRTRDWLVGQMVDLTAVISGPAHVADNATFNWTPPGNILRDYAVGATSAVAVPVTNDDGGYGSTASHQEPRTGYHMSQIRYFWVSTSAAPPGPDPDTVSVAIGGLAVGNANNISASGATKFSVYSPTALADVTPGVATEYTKTGSGYIGLLPAAGGVYGMSWHVGVSTPAGLAQGEFNLIQLVDPLGNEMKYGANVWMNNLNTWVLDGWYPYPPAKDANNTVITPFNSADGIAWITDEGMGLAADSPKDQLWTATSQTINGVTSVQFTAAFKTYIMYKPPGTGSAWVPLKMENWSFLVRASYDGQGWPVTNSWLNPPDFQLESNEPTWTIVQPANGPIFP